MELTISTASNTTLIKPNGELNIYSAASAKEQLLPFFSHAENIEIDLSQVTELDSAGVQLLVLAKRDINAAGREFRLSHHSHVVLDMFELYNLASFSETRY
jgi:anti-sigma B factor antagonist